MLTEEQERILRRVLWKPGRLYGDLWSLADSSVSEADKLAAIRRLSRRSFSQRAMFAPKRWAQLERYVAAYRDTLQGDSSEWISSATVWERLLYPPLVLVAGKWRLQLAGGENLVKWKGKSLYAWWRRRVGAEIERELLQNRTLAMRRKREVDESAESFDDDLTPDADELTVEARLAEAEWVFEFEDRLLDTLAVEEALNQLPDSQQQAIHRWLDGKDDQEEPLGGAERALRFRARKELARILARP